MNRRVRPKLKPHSELSSLASDQLVRMYGDFGMPIIEIDPAIIPKCGLPLVELLRLTRLAPTGAAAGKLIRAGRVFLNGENVRQASAVVSLALLKKGSALSLGGRIARCAVMMKR